MAKCTVCGKKMATPFWKPATACPECKAANLEVQEKLKQITPVLIVTPGLIGLNVLVFLAMAISGVSPLEPETADLIRWGTSFGPLSLGSEPWRSVTSMFVHIGIIHLLFNMWCLWELGRLGERMMGHASFLIIYVLSGFCGSLFSLWLHPQLVCAGASGAIFGIAGGLVALLALKKIHVPRSVLNQKLKSLLFFIGYNLLYGMRGGIDNAAHLGGLVGGAVLGAFLPQLMAEQTPGRETRYSPEKPDPMRFKLAATAMACLMLVGFGFVRHGHGPKLSTSELFQLEIVKMAKADRTTLLEAVKKVDAGKIDDGVIAKLKSVVSHAPASSIAHSILGEAYVQRNEFAPAIEEFRKTIAIRADDPVGHSDLGFALLQTAQFDQAVQEYRMALRLEPHDANSHNNLAVGLERLGDLNGALEEYRTAANQAPQNANFKNNYDRLSRQIKEGKLGAQNAK
jgi:membrane associated rhomboid family serine protease